MSKKSKKPKIDSNLSQLNYPNTSDLKSFLRFEKIPTNIYVNSDAASKAIANEVASIIKIKQLRKEKCLIGFATGLASVLAGYRFKFFGFLGLFLSLPVLMLQIVFTMFPEA